MTSEGWKTEESTLEPPSGFEHGIPGLGIQRLNYWAIEKFQVIIPRHSYAFQFSVVIATE